MTHRSVGGHDHWNGRKPEMSGGLESFAGQRVEGKVGSETSCDCGSEMKEMLEDKWRWKGGRRAWDGLDNAGADVSDERDCWVQRGRLLPQVVLFRADMVMAVGVRVCLEGAMVHVDGRRSRAVAMLLVRWKKEAGRELDGHYT
jgi:hypothetical protein